MIVRHKSLKVFGICKRISGGYEVTWYGTKGLYYESEKVILQYSDYLEVEENVDFICKPNKKCKMCYKKLECITN